MRRGDGHWKLARRECEERGRRKGNANNCLAKLGGHIEIVHGDCHAKAFNSTRQLDKDDIKEYKRKRYVISKEVQKRKKKKTVEVLKCSGSSPINCPLNFSTRAMTDDLDPPAFSLLGIPRLGHQTCRG